MDELNIDIHREIYLVPWKKEWAHIFRMEKQNILAALAASEHTADIRHVGSTSVRDMIAKPIIDIQICPNNALLWRPSYQTWSASAIRTWVMVGVPGGISSAGATNPTRPSMSIFAMRTIRWPRIS